MRKINEIIIHCSATPVSRIVPIGAIRDCHMKRGFKDVGYHYIIHQDGFIEDGRPLPQIGAHCKGHNRHSIGICYIGGLDEEGLPKDTRTHLQKVFLGSLVDRLLQMFPFATVHGHNEFANKACPCFDVKNEYSSLLKGGVNYE